jgi:hypothetical protein
MILPEGYELEFVVPSGSPEVFKNLIEYIDKEISLVLCGENEAGQAEAGSRASSQVANTVRVVRASELSEALSHTLSQTLIRWIVDLNFGVDVAAPVLTREFRIEESPLTMPDVSLLIQSGYTPRKEWIERHFRVELEQKTAEEGEDEQGTTFDPEEDKDLFNSVFGGDTPTPSQEQAAQEDLNAAASVTGEEPGAAPEETQADAVSNPSADEQLEAAGASSGSEADELSDKEILALLGIPDDDEDESTKPFGNQIITEDEAVNMDRK